MAFITLYKFSHTTVFSSRLHENNLNKSKSSKFILNFLFPLKNSHLCQDLNPGPPQYQADMLPTELSWLE